MQRLILFAINIHLFFAIKYLLVLVLGTNGSFLNAQHNIIVSSERRSRVCSKIVRLIEP
jgi:hypothetical protein